MAAFLAFQENISCINQVSWSVDNRIAFCSDNSVKCLVPGFPEWFNVRYDGDEDIYTAKLGEEYAEGDVTLANDVCHLGSDIQCQQSYILEVKEILDVTQLTEYDHKAFLDMLPRDEVQMLVTDRTMNPFKHTQDSLPRTGFCLLSWSPRGGDVIGRCILAGASHDHRLCLYSQTDSKLNWTTVANLSSITLEQERPKLSSYNSQEFHTFREWCYQQVPTAMCWKDGLLSDIDGRQYSILVVGTRSGDLIFWKVHMPCKEKSDCSLLHAIKLNKHSLVSAVKWKENSDVLAVGHADGMINLVSVDHENLEQGSNLRSTVTCIHGDADLIRVSDVCFKDHEKSYVMLVNKEHCILLYFLAMPSTSGQPVEVTSTVTLFGDNTLASVGMISLEADSVVMCSQDSVLQKIHINWQTPELSHIETLNTNLVKDRCELCLGMDVSPNNLLLTYVMRPKPGFDHLAIQLQRRFTHFNIKRLDDLDLTPDRLKIVTQLVMDPSVCLGDLQDAMVVHRLKLDLESLPDPPCASLTPRQLYRALQLQRFSLLLSVMQLQDRITTQKWPREEDNQNLEVFETRLNECTQHVLVLYAMSCLENLVVKEDRTELDEHGAQVLSCLCHYIEKHLDKFPLYTQRFQDIKPKLGQRVKTSEASVHNKCFICGETLQLDKMTLKCSNGHMFDLCCKTLTACELVDYITCTVCKCHSAPIRTLKGLPWLHQHNRCTFCEVWLL